MKDEDFLNKYSEEHYVSKKELEISLNGNDFEKKWNNILNYRLSFKIETELKDSTNGNYSLIINKKLKNDSYFLDTSLLKSSILISSFDENKKIQVLKHYKEKLIDSALRYYQIDDISKKLKENIINNEVEQVPLKLQVIYSIAKAFDYIVNENVSICDGIKKLYMILSNDNEVKFREVEKENFSSISYTQVKDIKDNFNNFITFLSESKIETSLLCLLTIYFFKVNQPFYALNDEISALTCMLIYKNNGYFLSSYLLDFASICFATSKTIEEKISDSQKSLDVTYFIYYVIPYLLQDINNINDYLKSIKDDEKCDSLIGDIQKTILPDFKEEINLDEIENKTEKMLELYPVLKRKEAHFYVTHCTIGLNYTINQFKTFEKTVYETARTSMDTLATLGFYEKKHIGNKFFYTPIVLKIK